jgi:hypothetical protein
MLRRIPRGPGFLFCARLDVVIVAGAAYFAWEHEQGRHGQPHLLCPICWLNRIAPAPEAPSESGPASGSGKGGDSSPTEPPEKT